MPQLITQAGGQIDNESLINFLNTFPFSAINAAISSANAGVSTGTPVTQLAITEPAGNPNYTWTGLTINAVSAENIVGATTMNSNALAVKSSTSVRVMVDSMEGATLSAINGKSTYAMAKAGLMSWTISSGNVKQTGSNAGSDYVIDSYDDTGAHLGVPFYTFRATGSSWLTATTAAGIPLTVAGITGQTGDLLQLYDYNTNANSTTLAPAGHTLVAKIDKNGVLNAAGISTQGTRTTQSAITPTGSPYTYTNADNSVETVYIYGGTVTNISIVRNSVTTQIASASGISVVLSPGDGVQVTYSVVPTMVKVLL